MRPALLFALGAVLVAGGVALIYIPAGVIIAGLFALGGSTLDALAGVARAKRARVAEDDGSDRGNAELTATLDQRAA